MSTQTADVTSTHIAEPHEQDQWSGCVNQASERSASSPWVASTAGDSNHNGRSHGSYLTFPEGTPSRRSRKKPKDSFYAFSALVFDVHLKGWLKTLTNRTAGVFLRFQLVFRWFGKRDGNVTGQ